jgi:hypothetical protein
VTQLPPIPKCVQATLFYLSSGGIPARNILYFSYTQTLSAADLGTICNNIATQWGSHMAAQTLSSWGLEGVGASDLSSQTAAQNGSTGATIPGTATGGLVGAAVSFVISNETARKYRGGHSRNYLPGIPQADLSDSNTWSVAAQTAILNAWTAFLQGIVTVGVPAAVGVLQHVVAHRYGKTAGSPVSASAPSTLSVPLTNPFFDQITAYKTNPQVGSQRRRNQQTG